MCRAANINTEKFAGLRQCVLMFAVPLQAIL